VPTMNDLWSTYGCTLCDDYPVLVLTVNNSDSKSSFQTNFIDAYGATSVCVPSEFGGTDFDQILGNNGSGGPCYLIAPDKSIKGWYEAYGVYYADESTIIAEGIQPHDCPITAIDKNISNPKTGDIRLFSSSKSSLSFNVQHAGKYAISIYSPNGQLMTTIASTNFHQGTNVVNTRLNSGFYIVQIDNGNSVDRQKLFVK